MKLNFLKTFLIISFFISYTGLFSQSYEITYDYAGNRLIRDIVELKKTNPVDTNQTNSLVQDSVQKSIVKFGNTTTVSIFPNPTPGIAQIEVGGELPESVSTIQVFDLTGKSILSTTFNERSTNIDLSAYPNGKYILKIICNNKSKEWILIKQ